MIINDLFTNKKPSVAEDANMNYIWIQGDFDGDTASTGATQGSWRDQQSTPVKLTRGRMSNVRPLSGPPPEGGKTIKQAQIPLTLDAGDQKFSTTGVDLQLTMAPNGYVTNGEVGRVRGTAVVKIMRPESVEEDLTRRGFLRGLGAAALAGAGGSALAGSNDPSFVGKVQNQHNAMIEKNPRYAKEHDALGIYIARGIAGASAENNKRWVEKTAQLLQKYGVKTNEGMTESMAGQVVFSGIGADGGKYEIIQSSPTDFMIHANGRHIDTYGSLQRAMSVLKNEVQGLQQGMAEGKKPDSYHIVNKDGKPATLASYADRASAVKDRDVKHPGAEVRQVGPRGKVKGVSEVSLGDYRKKAAVSQAGAKIDRFFGRDDAAKVAAADQTIAKREKGLSRADARIKPYTPPKFDAEKYQRDLTAKYPNIDELVADAERNRDPYYDRAEGSDYYAGREAEQLYQRLKQIQRVIQGLNESQDEVKKKYKQVPDSSGIINAATGRGYTPDELAAEYPDFDFDREEKQDERKRLKDLAKQERLKDKIKASLDDPRDTAKDLAKSFVNKGGLGLDFKPPTPTPTPAPAPVTVKGQPPGFTASNLAQQPGMAQYMQPKPTAPATKPAPNFAQGPAGYKTTTTTVAPTTTKTTAAAAPAGKKPTARQQQEYYKSLGLSEDLTWSRNFDPGRSLYRKMKQDR